MWQPVVGDLKRMRPRCDFASRRATVFMTSGTPKIVNNEFFSVLINAGPDGSVTKELM